MQNFNYEKKYHYILKYMLLGFPILLILVGSFIRGSEYSSTMSMLDGFVNNFLGLSINSWYMSIVSSFHLGVISGNFINNVLIGYPLYLIYVLMFDIVYDIFGLVLKLAHKFLDKIIGGGY